MTAVNADTIAARGTHRARLLALIAALVAVLIAVSACSSITPVKTKSGSGTGVTVGLKEGSVPPEFVGPLTQYGGTVCPEITAPILAGQIKAESNFTKGLTSPAGAVGYTQFMPGTWAAYGEGGDPNDPNDAVRAQAKYDCAMIAEAKKRACASDEIVKVALAMYNAGPGGVSGCTVPVNGETELYVPKILKAAEEYAAIGTGAIVPGGGGPFVYDPGKSPGENAVLAAMSQIGITYAWGGGTLTGPSQGIRDGGVADSFKDYEKIGWDCSGLSRFAIYQGSRGTKTLGRHTSVQEADGTPVAGVAAIQPGDLIFWPGHVAIAAGGGKMVEAQQSGTLVKISDIRAGGNIRRFLDSTAAAAPPAQSPAAAPTPAAPAA